MPHLLGAVGSFALCSLFWHILLSWQQLFGFILAALSLVVVLVVLRVSLHLSKERFLLLWTLAVPGLLSGTIQLLPATAVPLVLLWLVCGSWVYYRWWPVGLEPMPQGLHKARFAGLRDIQPLTTPQLPPDGLLLGQDNPGEWVSVRPTPARRELGNLLIVGATRSGKGLLATSQVLTWQASVVVNDIKGELFAATAGYRARLGDVYVLDPTGVGHRFDPLAGRVGEDQLFSAASFLLHDPRETDGRVFTQRATAMLTQLLLAAREAGELPLPFARSLIRLGLTDAARWLQQTNPDLATQFLDCRYEDADLRNNRFLISSWESLSAKMRPLLTETVVRCFAGADFVAQDLLLSDRPVTVYLRWPERDLLSLSPLVRLLWDSLVGELITIYDHRAGEGCQPVLLLIDEAGRTAIPTLADHATTVVGRGISLWIAVQSLSQLETVYGRERAQVLRDNMETQLYYRPTDLRTAKYLEERLGDVSAFALSETLREGSATSEGRSERGVPLLPTQQALQLPDQQIIAFHRALPPLRLSRVDWRHEPELADRRHLVAPALPSLPEIQPPAVDTRVAFVTAGYVD